MLRFELTDHLGNVRAVVSGKKKLTATSTNAVDILSLTDYYEFGMPMAARSYQSEAYRYGYQGSENDKELFAGTEINTDFRMLDPRIGRWLSTDKITQPYQSPFSSMDNNPINLTDELGLQTGGGTLYVLK